MHVSEKSRPDRFIIFDLPTFGWFSPRFLTKILTSFCEGEQSTNWVVIYIPQTTNVCIIIITAIRQISVHYVMGKSLPCLQGKDVPSHYCCPLTRKDSTPWSQGVYCTFSIWCLQLFLCPEQRIFGCVFSIFCMRNEVQLYGCFGDAATGCGLWDIGTLKPPQKPWNGPERCWVINTSKFFFYPFRYSHW